MVHSDPGGEQPLPPKGGSGRPRLSRLPRFVYWIAGAVIAGGGALIARQVGDTHPEFRIAAWLIGGAVIFLGLAVLSLGTKSRTMQQPPEKE